MRILPMEMRSRVDVFASVLESENGDFLQNFSVDSEPRSLKSLRRPFHLAHEIPSRV